jgi:hypothetical protein
LKSSHAAGIELIEKRERERVILLPQDGTNPARFSETKKTCCQTPMISISILQMHHGGAREKLFFSHNAMYQTDTKQT